MEPRLRQFERRIRALRGNLHSAAHNSNGLMIIPLTTPAEIHSCSIPYIGFGLNAMLTFSQQAPPLPYAVSREISIQR